jgi:processive 1,2-diacylglycerol beta-glucosyltransferase
MKVVIFTEDKVGEGHYQAARAVAHALSEISFNQIQVNLICGMRLIHPYFEKGAVKAYLSMIRYCPRIWSYLYHHVRNPSLLQQKLFQSRLSRYIEQQKPHIILCTHPACVRALAGIKLKLKNPFKLGVIFTDFGFHPFAVSAEVDYFFVSHPFVKDILVQQYNIKPFRIFDYGIPVHPEYERVKVGDGAESMNTPAKPVRLLVLGGALGIGPLREIMDQFRPYPELFKLTIICGKNKALYQELIRIAPDHVKVLGYVTNMVDMIREADAVLSKPGGLTVMETLLCRTPLFMLPPLPGQEESNRRYLEQNGLSWTVKLQEPLPEMILNQLNKIKRDQEWVRKVDAHILRGAAHRIARKVLEEIN